MGGDQESDPKPRPVRDTADTLSDVSGSKVTSRSTFHSWTQMTQTNDHTVDPDKQ